MEEHQNNKRQNCETSKWHAVMKANACAGTILVLIMRLIGCASRTALRQGSATVNARSLARDPIFGGGFIT
jgi:hypothetical protein